MAVESSTSETLRGARDRLGRVDRRILVVLTILAGATLLMAMGAEFFATMELFGEQATVREEAIAAHAGRAATWALLSPFCGGAVLRGGRRALAGAAIWLALTAWSAWWWWPGPPTESGDTERPLWYLDSFGLDAIPWLLVAAGLAIGFRAAWRSDHGAAKLAAVVIAIATATGGVLSERHLHQRADAERPVPTAKGSLELTALKADPLWDALPEAEPVTTGAYTAARTSWGELTSTGMWRTLGTREDRGLFRRAVAAAEGHGWQLIDTRCFAEARQWSARFAKVLPVGPATLDLEVASYTRGVRVSAVVREAGPGRQNARCWES